MILLILSQYTLTQIYFDILHEHLGKMALENNRFTRFWFQLYIYIVQYICIYVCVYTVICFWGRLPSFCQTKICFSHGWLTAIIDYQDFPLKLKGKSFLNLNFVVCELQVFGIVSCQPCKNLAGATDIGNELHAFGERMDQSIHLGEL